jgi:hypothetical protein
VTYQGCTYMDIGNAGTIRGLEEGIGIVIGIFALMQTFHHYSGMNLIIHSSLAFSLQCCNNNKGFAWFLCRQICALGCPKS